MTSRAIRALLAAVLCVTASTLSGVALTAGSSAVAAAVDEPVTFQQLASLDELTDNHARIFRLYWAYFDRTPDPAGALFWIDRHEQCWDLQRIAAFFTESPEFSTTYGPITAGEFVDLVYRNVLDRSPDETGRAYWLGRLEDGSIGRTRLMLDFSWSDEFVRARPLPSDGVPNRGCRPPAASDGFQSFVLQNYTPFATVGAVTVHYPTNAVAHVGFHESNRGGGLQQVPLGGDTGSTATNAAHTTMPSRNRGTPSRSAADVVVHPMADVRAPVTGTVLRAGNYTLYCTYRDGYAVIRPDAAPHLEVGVLHVTGVAVRPGDRVTAGVTPLADHATKFSFSSQVDDYTAAALPHVHIEVVDPAIPNRPTSSSC